MQRHENQQPGDCPNFRSTKMGLSPYQILLAGTAILIAVASAFLAPTEATMGDAQRIVYIHVAMAWRGLLGYLVMAAAGAVYLIGRNPAWDHWARAAAELGWLCCGLTLITGSLWAHAAWNTWWTWDPRLTASLILWVMYWGCLLVRGGPDDPQRRARLGAILAIVGVIDVPLVVMATRWFRGIHPTSPAMEPSMRAVLLMHLVGFTALFIVLLVLRRTQLHIEHLLAEWDLSC